MIAHQKLCRWPRAGRRTSLTVQAASLPTGGVVDRPACRKKHATSVLLASLAAAAQVLVLPGPAIADTPTSASQPTVDAVARAPQSPSLSSDASSPGSLVEELQVSASHMASALQSVGIKAEAPALAAPASASRPQPAVADVAEAAPQPSRPATMEAPSSHAESQAPLDALAGGPAGSDRGGSAAGRQLIASSLQGEAPPLASLKAPEEPQPVQGGMLSQQQEPAGGASLAGPQEALGMLAADIDELLSAADLPALEAPDLPSYEELLAMYGLGSPAVVTAAAGGEAGALLAASDSLAVSQRAVAAIPAKGEPAAAGNNSQAPAEVRPVAWSRAAPQEVISAIGKLAQGVAAGDSLAAPQEAVGSDASDAKPLPGTTAAAVVAKDVTSSDGVGQQAVQP